MTCESEPYPEHRTDEALMPAHSGVDAFNTMQHNWPMLVMRVAAKDVSWGGRPIKGFFLK